MAAYFTFSSPEHRAKETHIFCHPAASEKLRSLALNCVSVQLDGDELLYALQILGRPTFPNRVANFYGHDAQMICGNWK